MSERRDIYLRAHTVKVQTREKQKKNKKQKEQPPKWPPYALIFDTETRTDVQQRLMFGIFRLCRLVNGQYRCEREGIFYSGETEPGALDYSAVLDKSELNAIGRFVSSTMPDVEVKGFPPKLKLEVYQTFESFMEKVFWPAVREGYLITAFNAPFDLSRISRDWRATRGRRGFNLIMKLAFSVKKKRWIPGRFRPLIRIEPKDARTAFITRGTTKKPKEWPNAGRFLDLSTLLFALFDEHTSLRAWGEEFEKLGYKVDKKLDHPPSGRVTKDELDYCRHDVRITAQYLNVAKAEFDKHPLPRLLPDRAYSPASIGKAYLAEMGIIPPSEKFHLSDRELGITMEPYYGGRAECHVRRRRVPVMLMDFMSQYPTVNTLLTNFEILTAESITLEDATEEVRELLKHVTLDACFNPKLWPKLRFFALVQPDHDIFPVRAAYKRHDDSLNIGVNYLTSDKPIYFAGPDIVSSILLNGGKVPHVIRAFRVVPHGKQAGMKPVRLLGEVTVDPNKDDFFKHVIEQRKANKSNKLLYKALKIIANSTAYGCFVELNEQIISEPSGKRREHHEWTPPKLEVFSGEHYHSQPAPREIEVPGRWYFPPLGALITSGGRLLLAIAEASVTNAGGTYLFCDTDSLAVCSSKTGKPTRGGSPNLVSDFARDADTHHLEPIPTLSWNDVKKISERFASLNPYSFSGTILDIKEVNHVDEDKSKPFREIFGYSVSSKRYCLFTGKHVKEIIDPKAHGIGYLMPPRGLRRDETENEWTTEFWRAVLSNEGISSKGIKLDWLDRAAAMRVTVSSPAVMGRLKNYVKPFDFMLAPVTRDSKRGIDEQSEKPILITRFTPNSEEWLRAEYYNLRTGLPCSITTAHDSKSADVVPVRTYRDVLNSYVNNPESKFLGPDGKRCTLETRGVLQRMHVIAGEYIPCGKEFKRKLEQGVIIDADTLKPGGTPDDPVDANAKIYLPGKVALSDSLKDEIRKAGTRELMRHGIGQHTIENALHSRVKAKTLKNILVVLQKIKQENATTHVLVAKGSESKYTP